MESLKNLRTFKSYRHRDISTTEIKFWMVWRRIFSESAASQTQVQRRLRRGFESSTVRKISKNGGLL